jgi:hypothetical protein
LHRECLAFRQWTHDWEIGATGLFGNTPNGLGFEYFYGFNSGGGLIGTVGDRAVKWTPMSRVQHLVRSATVRGTHGILWLSVE